MNKAMTFDDLLNRAAAKQKRANDTLDITLLDGESTMTFSRIAEDKMLKLIDEITSSAGDAPVSNAMIMADHLIYLSCGQMQDPDLQKQLDAAEPWDVVAKIFELDERNHIATKLMEWLDVDSLVGDVKNA